MNWMRDNMKTIVWITVTSFLATIFAGWGMGYVNWGQSRNLGTVNGKTLEFNEFQNYVDQQRNIRQQDQQRLSSDDMDDIQREAFKNMVDDILLRQHLKQLEGEATQAEVQRFLQSRFDSRQQMQQFFQQASKRRIQSLQDRERNRINSRKMRQWLTNEVSLTQVELTELLRLGLREARTYAIYLNPEQLVSEQKVESYYQNNQSQFILPSRIQIREIALEAPDNIRQNPERLQEIKSTVETIKRQHKAGEPFSELAQDYSEDTSTADQGGMVGWINQAEPGKEIYSNAFKLDSGEISNLLKSDTYYHLLYVDSGPVRSTQSLTDVRTRIQQRLMNDTHWAKANDQIDQLHNEISSSARPKQAIQNLASTHSHSATAQVDGDYGWVPAKWITRSLHDGADSKVWRQELSGDSLTIRDPVSQRLFHDDPDSLREPLRTKEGYHLFYVAGFRPPRSEELSEEDQQLIFRQIRTNKRIDFMARWLNQQRRQANIKLNVPPSRIGGQPDFLDTD